MSKLTLAIIAHDGKKADLMAFAMFNRDTLARWQLVATKTTGSLLRDKVGLEVDRVESGPAGGDAQVAAQVVTGDVDAVIFLVDPLDKHPHDPDIQMLGFRSREACVGSGGSPPSTSAPSPRR